MAAYEKSFFKILTLKWNLWKRLAQACTSCPSDPPPFILINLPQNAFKYCTNPEDVLTPIH